MLGHFQHGSSPLARPASHNTGLFHTDTFVTDRSPVNPSVARMIGLASGFYFRGPLLAHGYEDDKTDERGDWEDCGRPHDLDTADLSYLLGFFQA